MNEWSGLTTKIEKHTLTRIGVNVRVLEIGSPIKAQGHIPLPWCPGGRVDVFRQVMVRKIGGMGVLPQLDIRQKSSRLEYRSTRAYTLRLAHWRSGRLFIQVMVNNIIKCVRLLHGRLNPVDQTDVSGVVTNRTDASKPGRHLERMVRPDNQD